MIPKMHYKDITDIPTATLADMMDVTKKIILHYQNILGSTGANIMAATGEGAQQSTPHFHFHILPRFKNDGLDTRPKLPDIDVDKDEVLKKIQIVE
ncbi:MAG: HIT family protein [bacterium]